MRRGLIFGIFCGSLLAGLACSRPGSKVIAALTIVPEGLVLGANDLHQLEIRLRALRWPIVGGCPTFFVHLVDSSGTTVRSFDHRPPVWMPGEEIRYSLALFQSALSDPLPEGRYELVMGAYHPGDGSRFRLQIAGAEENRRRYSVVEVVIEAPVARAEVSFGEGWYPTEAGTDIQIIRRRWFFEKAKLEISGKVDEGQVLWLLVNLPDAKNLDGVTSTAMPPREGWVRGSCLDQPVKVSAGRRELFIPIPSLGERESCQIELASDFSFFDSGQKRSMSLEALAWASP